MVFGGRVDELESDGRRAGHESGGVGEVTGGMGGEGRVVEGRFFTDDRKNLNWRHAK